MAKAERQLEADRGLTLEGVEAAGDRLLRAADKLDEVAQRSIVAQATDQFHGPGGNGAAAPLGAQRPSGAVPGVLGRALAGFGASLSQILQGQDAYIASRGGQAYGPETVLEPDFPARWSAHLTTMSAESFTLTAESFEGNLQHVQHLAEANYRRDAMTGATRNIHAAAEQTLAAARETGNQAAVEVAEQAVELARVAHRDAALGTAYFELSDSSWGELDPATQAFARERLTSLFPGLSDERRPPPAAGLDAASPALYAAGTALVAAGRAVVAARSTAAPSAGE